MLRSPVRLPNTAARLAIAIAATIMACGGPAALAAQPRTSHARRAKPCRKSQLTVKLRGSHTGCITVRKLTTTRQLSGIRSDGHALWLRPKQGGRRHRLPAVLTSRKMLAGMRHAIEATSSGSAADAQAAHAGAHRTGSLDDANNHTSEPISTKDGWTGTTTADRTDTQPSGNDAGEVASEVDSVTQVQKGHKQARIADHSKVGMQACPTVEGEWPGTLAYDHTTTLTNTEGGQSAHLISGWSYHGTMQAHTGDDGNIRDFDLHITIELSATATVTDSKGHVLQTAPPKRSTLRISRSGLHVGKAADEILSGTGLAIDHPTGAFAAWRSSNVPKVAQASATVATFAAMLAAKDADHWLGIMQHAINNGVCLDVAVAASDLPLSPKLNIYGQQTEDRTGQMHDGQTMHPTFTMSARHGQQLAAGTFSMSIYRSLGGDTGQLSPMSGGFTSAPVGLTYTAPGSGWTKPAEVITMYFGATSKQGRKYGVIEVTPISDNYELRYTHATSGAVDYTYDDSSGSRTDLGRTKEQRDVSVSAAVPLTRGADGTYSGSAPLTWGPWTWWTDDDNTATSGQSASIVCELDDHETLQATTNGTLSVSGLVPGPNPAAKLVASGVADLWHQDDLAIAGPCPGYTHDYPRTEMMGSLWNAHAADNRSLTHDKIGNIASVSFAPPASAWQAGTGDVVAVRTISGTEPSLTTHGSQYPVAFTDTLQLVRVP